MDAILNKPDLTIGCLSSQEKLPHVFRSMIRVFSQFTQSGLRRNWVYQDQDQQSLDVYILDLDDEHNRDLAASNPQLTVIAISSHPDLLDGQKHSLNKPLRSQSLLQVLKDIEKSLIGYTSSEPTQATEKSSSTIPTAYSDAPAHTGDRIIALDARRTSNQVLTKTYQLSAWPELTLVSDDAVVNVARVCALLSRQPATRDTLADFLALSPEQTQQALDLIARLAPASLVTTEQHSTEARPSAASSDPKPSSFLAKIWNKLKGAA